MIDRLLESLRVAFDTLATRVRVLEANDRSEVTGGVQAMTFASLPAAGQPGRLRFCANCRKVGEGVGAGTGTPVYDDGGASWRRTGDDTIAAV